MRDMSERVHSPLPTPKFYLLPVHPHGGGRFILPTYEELLQSLTKEVFVQRGIGGFLT